jgi:hypothetical protein
VTPESADATAGMTSTAAAAIQATKYLRNFSISPFWRNA